MISLQIYMLFFFQENTNGLGHDIFQTPKKSDLWEVEVLIQPGGVGKAHSFEVYWGQQSSVISVSARPVLFPDITVQTGSLPQA